METQNITNWIADFSVDTESVTNEEGSMENLEYRVSEEIGNPFDANPPSREYYEATS